MRQWSVRICLALLGIVLLLGLALGFLLGTQGGTRFLFARLGALMPGSFAVAHIDGSIASPLTVSGLVYKRPGLEVDVDRLELRWRLRELLSRRLDIQRLDAEGVRVLSVPQPSREPTKLPDLHLSYNIIVRQATVRRLAVGAPGDPSPLRIDRIDLATTAAGDRVRIDRLSLRSAQLNADLKGLVQPQGDYPVDLALSWAFLPSGLSALAGHGRLTGTLARLRLDHLLTRPFPVRLGALLEDPLHDLRFDATLDAPAFNPHLLRADLPDVAAGCRLRARGSLADLTSVGTVRGAFAVTGPVILDYDLRRRGNSLQVARAEFTLPASAAQVSLSGNLDLPGQEAAATAPIGGGGGGRGSGAGSAGPAGQDRQPGQRGRPKPDQAAARNPVFKADLRASWRNLAWPLTGPPQLRSPHGEAEISGDLDHYRARLAADLEGPAGSAIPASRLRLAGRGDGSHFEIAGGDAALLSGTLDLKGSLAWRPRVSWNLALNGHGLDPAALRPDLAGSLALSATSRGELRPDGPAGSFDLTSLRGVVRRQPVAASLAATVAGSRYQISHAAFSWGSASLRASGSAGDHLDLAWEAALPNLGLFLPEATGEVTARGKLAGTPAAPHVQTHLEAHGLRVAGQSVAGATLDADVDLAPQGRLQIDLAGNGVAAAGQTVAALAVRGRGTAADHTLEVTAQGMGDRPETRLKLAVAGGLSGGWSARTSWRGQIRVLDLVSQPLGSWSLQKPAGLDASASAASLADLCWQSGGGHVCVSGTWASAGPWTASADLSALPLALARPLLPPDLMVTGTVAGKLRASGSGPALSHLDLDLAPGPGDLRFPAEQGRTADFHFERGAVRAQAGGGSATASASLTLTGIGTLGSHLVVPRFNWQAPLPDQALSGSLELHWTDLGFVAGFAPELHDVGGRLDASFQIAGTVGAPRLRGQATLAGARAQLPAYGLEIKGVRLTVTADGSQELGIEGSASSGPGSVTVRGRTGLIPSQQAPLHLTLAGSRFQVMATREVRIQVSPRLDLAYDGSLVRLDGQVVVPAGLVLMDKQGKAGPVAPSPDVVFVGPRAEQVLSRQQPAGLAVAAQVRVILPQDSFDLAYLGLKARPSGTLLASEQPGRPASGVGEIQLGQGGTFRAYGQDLRIDHGRIIFGGPIDNPGLDIRASRLADDGVTTAGLDIKGTVKSPEVTIWSQPAMTETEALAYLMLGHPLGQSNSQEGSLLANAATSLGLKGGDVIAKRLATRFGLDEASLESRGSLSEASLMLGKYLSPHLYVAYGIGLFQPVSTFRIRYILSKHWSLQAESGPGSTATATAGTGADILYTLERGGKPRKPKPTPKP